jgi:micrococcal nuclease
MTRKFFLLLIIALCLNGCASSAVDNNDVSQTPTTNSEVTEEPEAQPEPHADITEQEPEETISIIEAQVTRVIDGDTIEVSIDGQIYKVRYIGIDTPETVHPTKGEEPYGREACDKNKELVEGEIVTLEKDVSEIDQYGRLLRYVYVGSLFINAELVRLGYAQVATYPPDVKYQDLFLQLQREAREEGRGLWGLEEAIEEEANEEIDEGTHEEQEEPPSENVDVRITKIFYDGLVYRTESDEYVEIKNMGSESVDLAGWRIVDIDEGYPSLTFPSYTLEPGEIIRVYTNEYHPEYGGFSFGSGKAVWNNSDPDTAVLYDSDGREVSRKSY